MTLILASSSPYRRALLTQAGYAPKIVKPNVDESLTKTKYLSEGALVIAQKLARLKCETVFNQTELQPPMIVVGSDQVCLHKGQILDKPGNMENNVRHLMKMQNSTHSLLTAVCMIFKKDLSHDPQYFEFYDQTDLTMKALSEDEIRLYINQDQPFDCAGGYKYESLGHTLMVGIKSKDITAIQGLPMMACQEIFEKLGLSS